MPGEQAARPNAVSAKFAVACALSIATCTAAYGIAQETPAKVATEPTPAAVTPQQSGSAAALTAEQAPSPFSTVTAEQDPRIDLYVQKCASCHTVGKGARVGPDLAGAHQRRDQAWLIEMISTPSRMLSRDPEARALLAQYNGVKMPDLGLTSDQVTDLIDLITLCSNTPCELAGKFVPVAETTENDILLGESLFLGTEPLAGGAVPCISCHTVAGASTPVPGGSLGVELTHTFARLGDEGLDAALRNPAFPVMNRVFQDHPLEADEALALRAFLDAANKGAGKDNAALSVALFGVLVAGTILILLNALWARRLRGVRQPLTARAELMRRSQNS